MNELTKEKLMTVKEVAEVLGLDPRTVQLKVKELFPEIVKERKTTYLNEEQVTSVKLSCEKKFAVTTDLEKKLIIAQAMQILNDDITELRKSLTTAKPKIDFFDQVTNSKDAISIGSAAKVLHLGMGRNKLFKLLREKQILMSNNQPYQEFIDRGYFRTIEQKYTTPDGETHISIKTIVYQRGLDYIRKVVK